MPARRNVLHSGHERQKGPRPTAEMSFIGIMKDKREAIEGPNVFHQLNERQKRDVSPRKCPS
ncbi:hypothetical protein DXF96_07655 [Heyndrickxia coagulans]|nr:hypothetical protein CYJ15_02090 [Heyndrickxia coagulans]QDI61370.1 hypothetical protein DXF96_07655 [Heyndrickxia coagulans]